MTRLWVLVLVQAMVAAASLVVEIVAGRMLAPYVGMSLYTWTSIIAVVLAGFSVGHWVGGRLAEWPEGAALRANGWAMLAAALTTGGAVLALRWSAAAVSFAGALLIIRPGSEAFQPAAIIALGWMTQEQTSLVVVDRGAVEGFVDWPTGHLLPGADAYVTVQQSQ